MASARDSARSASSAPNASRVGALDVQDPEGPAVAPQRHRELAAGGRREGDVVGVRAHVRDPLRKAGRVRAPDHAVVEGLAGVVGPRRAPAEAEEAVLARKRHRDGRPAVGLPDDVGRVGRDLVGVARLRRDGEDPVEQRLAVLLARDLPGQPPVRAREHGHRPDHRREGPRERRDRRRQVAVSRVQPAEAGGLEDRTGGEGGGAAREGDRGDHVQEPLPARAVAGAREGRHAQQDRDQPVREDRPGERARPDVGQPREAEHGQGHGEASDRTGPGRGAEPARAFEDQRRGRDQEDVRNDDSEELGNATASREEKALATTTP